MTVASAPTKPNPETVVTGDSHEFVTLTIDGQLFGIPVAAVQDVLGPQKITRIPLAQPEVAGALNLRGRIVTAIDVRRRLNLPPRPPENAGIYRLDGRLLVVLEVERLLQFPGGNTAAA